MPVISRGWKVLKGKRPPMQEHRYRSWRMLLWFWCFWVGHRRVVHETVYDEDKRHSVLVIHHICTRCRHTVIQVERYLER